MARIKTSSVGDRIREIRIAAEMTQDELAEQSGLSRKWINRLENGRDVSPRLVTLVGIAKALGVPCEDLLAEPIAA